MGDLLRLAVEEGDASGFTGSWEASFAHALGAGARVVSGRFRARRIDA